MEKDLGCAALLAIWKQVPGRESPHIDTFVDFLNANEKILSINQDQWKSFVQFSKQVLPRGPLDVGMLLFLSAGGWLSSGGCESLLTNLHPGLLAWTSQVDASLIGYTEDDPWPSLFDDYVAWVKQKRAKA